MHKFIEIMKTAYENSQISKWEYESSIHKIYELCSEDLNPSVILNKINDIRYTFGNDNMLTGFDKKRLLSCTKDQELLNILNEVNY